MQSEQPWSIEFYQDSLGRRPVAEFINSLEIKMRDKVFRSLDILEQFGDRLPMPLARPVSGYRFSELRVPAGGNIVRIFSFSTSGRRIILLHGFTEKTQRIPRQELQIAGRRWDEYMRGE